MGPQTDQQALVALMARVAARDDAALRRLYALTSAKLFGVCVRILGDAADAEDVLQDVYVTIWRRADRFDATRASVIAWTAAIARNRAIDRLRARGPAARSEPIEGLEIADGAEGIERELEIDDERRALQRCLETLDGRTAAAIRTAFFEGLSYQALAERAGTPLGTMKSWIRRGLAKLKGCLEP